MIRALRIVAAVAIVIATAYALRAWTLEPLRCARITWSAQHELDAAEPDGSLALKRAAAGVRESLEDCRRLPNHELFFVLGSAASALDDHRSAIVEYRHALEFDRRPETYFALGTSEVDALEHNAAIDDLARACAFDPARLADIRYDEIRRETKQRILATYGANWLR